MIERTIEGHRLQLAPVLHLVHGGVRTLPDPSATLRIHRTGLTARWPDGTQLRLHLTRDPHGLNAQVYAVAGAAGLSVDSLGLRLIAPTITRALIDGYHSWDWAGLRDLTLPGTGWWGAVLGTPVDPSSDLALRLASPPRQGALHLRWTGEATLDAVTTGEPNQETIRTGPPTMLGRFDPGALIATDPIRLNRIPPTMGAGLPVPLAGSHRPGGRLVGWMSWNCLGPTVCVEDILAARRLVPEHGVLLLDDGWMQRWGDWVEGDDLGTTLPSLATALRDSGHRLGIWLAPFLVDPRSNLATHRPDWLLRDVISGGPVQDLRPGEPRHVLDASLPGVRRHLTALGTRLGRAGVGALKIDFLYAGALPGRRQPGWTGIRSLRAGVAALAAGFRRTAAPPGAIWACGSPAPPLIGLVDACRSGGDAVINVPSTAARVPPRAQFLHGVLIRAAQERNLAARAWLWGTTLPPDVDAVTLGPVGATPAIEPDAVRAWLRLGGRSGGPLLISDHTVDPSGRAALRRAQHRVAGTPPIPVRPRHPLAGIPTPPEDDDFLSGAPTIRW